MKSSYRFIALSALLTLFAFTAVIYTSCKNKCGSTTCQNGGTCADNVCICPTGYSGNNCGTAWTDVVTGTYTCSRSDCSPAVAGVNSWESVITKDATYGGYIIDISNFNDNNIIIAASVDTFENILISPAAGATGVNGKGTYSNGVINLEFTTGSVSCKMVLRKK